MYVGPSEASGASYELQRHLGAGAFGEAGMYIKSLDAIDYYII